jgi:dipeptidyl aminopeptidase/acylaminoacyl peptidase
MKGVSVIGLLSVMLVASAGAQGSHALSSDGKYIALAENDTLWLIASSGKEKPKLIATGSTFFLRPKFSPTSDQLAYYSAKTGSLQIWSYNLASGKSRQLTHIKGGVELNTGLSLWGYIGEQLSFTWSPDGKSIVFPNQAPRPSGGFVMGYGASAKPVFPSQDSLAAGLPIVLDRSTPLDWTLFGVVTYGAGVSLKKGKLVSGDSAKIRPPMVNQLYLLDVASGKTRQLTTDAADYVQPEFSPDGSRIVFVSMEGNTPSLSMESTTLYTLDIETGARKAITRVPLQKTMPHWSPDGKWIVYVGRAGFHRTHNGAYVVPSDGSAEPRSVTDKLNRTLRIAGWSPDGKVLVHYTDGLAHPLAKIDINTQDFERLSTPTGVVGGFDGSKGGVVWSEVRHPDEGEQLMVMTPADAKPRVVMDVVSAASLTGKRRHGMLSWVNSRGDTIDGLIIYPRNYAQGKRYPMVLDAYGVGSATRHDESEGAASAPEYVVFRPNHRAPHMWVNETKSTTYDSAAAGPNGIAVMVDDIMSGVDTLVNRGLVDPDRMCIYGFSNGGLQGLQVLTQTERFKCAVIHSPATADFSLGYFLGYPDGARIMYGKRPFDDPALYTALIPLYHADKIKTPMLLAAGDLESLVLPTIEMFNALRWQGRDATLLRYPSMGHVLSGRAQQDFNERVKKFFARYLQ